MSTINYSDYIEMMETVGPRRRKKARNRTEESLRKEREDFENKLKEIERKALEDGSIEMMYQANEHICPID